jgi:transcription initiation factor IIF auxiliary subunit
MIMEQEQFAFKNYSRLIEKRGGYKWFEWSVFMNETDKEKLNKVKSVEYRLHDSFPNPIRMIDTRNNRFALKTFGYGEFMVFIKIYLKDGTERSASHYLKFEENNWGDPARF